MSLDVTIIGKEKKAHNCVHCGKENQAEVSNDFYFSANITHNLGKMADEAGIYNHVWNPEEIGITKAGELIEPLKTGIQLMKSNPARFEAFNSPNGWGMYEHFLPWLEKYLEACEACPDGIILISR